MNMNHLTKNNATITPSLAQLFRSLNFRIHQSPPNATRHHTHSDECLIHVYVPLLVFNTSLVDEVPYE